MEEVAIDAVKQPERPPLLQVLGPGLVTGASDDDPSGIATYSQIGASFGFGMAWTLVASYPLMCAIQEISARIGRVTGHGIAGNLRRHYPPWAMHGIVLLLLLANTINIGADLGAMGAALKLLIGGPDRLYVVLFGLATIGFEVFMRYARYAKLLKWLTLTLFAYVAAVFIVKLSWAEVAEGVFLPKIVWSRDYILGVVAVLGTTISPYLFFWQAEQEVEEEEEHPSAKPLIAAPGQAKKEFARIRVDTLIGMAVSNVVALAIIVTTAATLHAQGVTDIQTSAQAAEALRPVAGRFAFAVFSLGIIGTGLLALPVLAGSSAYALGEANRWVVGLARKPKAAVKFYAAIAVGTLIGVAINFTAIDPIKALFWSAVVNGVVAVPVMVMMMRLSVNRHVMGQFRLPLALHVIGWIATAVMALTVLGLIISLFAGS